MKKYFLVGIGGTGMSSLAQLLLAEGAQVIGSDRIASRRTLLLEAAGANVLIGHSEANLPPDTDELIISAAISSENPERVAAAKANIPVRKYAQLVGEIMEQQVGVAVSGTHGKTTTTAMLIDIFATAGLAPAYVVGGELITEQPNSRLMKGGYFIAEACEYDRSFLNLHPRFAIVNNVEPDHLDYYGSFEALLAAFSQFAAQVEPWGALIINGEDRFCRSAAEAAAAPVQTFGTTPGCSWQIKKMFRRDGKSPVSNSFLLCDPWGEDVELPLAFPGRHNIMNAAAACALAYAAGIDYGSISRALASFTGVGRRFERLDAGRFTIIDDYAHHPTEISATIEAAREFYPERRICVLFQPHQRWRTRTLFNQFISSLSVADRVILLPVYSVREGKRAGRRVGSARLAAALKARGCDAMYLATLEEAAEFVQQSIAEEDVFLMLGAGTITNLARTVANSLRTEGARYAEKACVVQA